MKFPIIAVLLYFIVQSPSQAQQINYERLDLNEAIDNTIANNNQLKIADYDYKVALADINQIDAYRLPQVDAFMTGTASDLPLNAFGTVLQQGGIEESDFAPASLNSPPITTNLQTQIRVQQPILNMDIKDMRTALKTKAMAIEQKGIRTQYILKNKVISTYLHLQYLYEVVDVLKKAKKTTLDNLKITRDNVDAGYLHASNLLEVEVRITDIDNQLFATESNIKNLSDQLSFLMGTELGKIYKPVDALTEVDLSNVLLESFSPDRSDVKALDYQLEAQNQMLQATQKSKLPRINAFGSYEINNALGLQDAQSGFMLGVQASWKLYDGRIQKNKIEKAKILIDKTSTNKKMILDQIKLQLKMTKRSMLHATNQIALAKKSIKQSKENLRVKIDRYTEGLEKTIDVLNAETILAQKELSLVEALYKYRLSNANIELIIER